jgi:phospholipid/cholesterol/gamma-HCH transport system substrate-binding protein
LNDHKILEIKVGITILIGVIMLVLGIVWLKGITFKPNTFEIRMLFPNTGGLQIGDPALVSGLKVGKVTDIQLTGDSVMVLVSLSNSVQLRADVTGLIASSDFFGGKKVDIVPGKSGKKYDGKSVVRGQREPDITELTSQLKEIAVDVKGTLRKVDTVLVGISGVVNDKSFAHSLKQVVKQLDETTEKIARIADKSDAKIDSMLTRLSGAARTFRTLVQKTDGKIDTTFSQVTQITTSIAHLTASLDSMATTIQRGEGNLGKLIYDDKLYHRIDRTVMQLDSLVEAVRERGMKVNLKLFGD